jgi:glycerol dehydrogenase-like iron-containing ADH family enzyme
MAQIEAENQALYGNYAESFNAVARKKRISDSDYIAYVQNIQTHWTEIWEALDPFVAPVARIKDAFDLAGVPYKLADVHRTREQAREALLHGGHYRPRYTVLDLFWELGLFPQAADEILERSGVLENKQG